VRRGRVVGVELGSTPSPGRFLQLVVDGVIEKRLPRGLLGRDGSEQGRDLHRLRRGHDTSRHSRPISEAVRRGSLTEARCLVDDTLPRENRSSGSSVIRHETAARLVFSTRTEWHGGCYQWGIHPGFGGTTVMAVDTVLLHIVIALGVMA